tara:strand:+ start:376 stop:657 length:282 start_codon:yes stop_codon:yes gene_type:complete
LTTAVAKSEELCVTDKRKLDSTWSKIRRQTCNLLLSPWKRKPLKVGACNSEGSRRTEILAERAVFLRATTINDAQVLRLQSIEVLMEDLLVPV